MRISQYRWLVSFTKDETEDVVNAWSECIYNNGDITASKESLLEFVKKFGIIPRFSHAYEVNYNRNTGCVKYNCRFWNRLHIPCWYLLAVVSHNSKLSKLYPNRFPMSSVTVR